MHFPHILQFNPVSRIFPVFFFVPRLSFYPLISLVHFPCGKLDAKSDKFSNWLTKISVIIRKTEMSAKLKVAIRTDRTFFTYIFSVFFSAVFFGLLFLLVADIQTNHVQVTGRILRQKLGSFGDL